MFIPHGAPPAAGVPVDISAWLSTFIPIAWLGLGVISAVALFGFLAHAIIAAFSDPKPVRKAKDKPLEIDMGVLYRAIHRAYGEWEEKPKRKNDEDDSLKPGSHFMIGDDGELLEVIDEDEKPKRRED